MSERKPLYQSECYKLALHIIVSVQGLIKTLHPEEKYDLTAQIRRSSESVTANIAEGYGRYHYLDSLYKYSIARAELNETLSHVINARVLGYIEQPMFDSVYLLIRETEQTLNGYMASVQRQRMGSKEFGDKTIREDAADYLVKNDVEINTGNNDK